MPLLHDDGVREDVREGARGDPRGHRRRPPSLVPLPVRSGTRRPAGPRPARGARLPQRVLPGGGRGLGAVADRRGRRARRRSRGALEHGDGAVVLLHTWPAPTAEARARDHPRPARIRRGPRRRSTSWSGSRDAPAGDPGGRRRRLEDRRRAAPARRRGARRHPRATAATSTHVRGCSSPRSRSAT